MKCGEIYQAENVVIEVISHNEEEVELQTQGTREATFKVSLQKILKDIKNGKLVLITRGD